jgi:hypothetical protein
VALEHPLRFDAVAELRELPLDAIAVGGEAAGFLVGAQGVGQMALGFLLASPADQLLHGVPGDLVEVLVLRGVGARPPRLQPPELLAEGLRDLPRGLGAMRLVLLEQAEDQRLERRRNAGVPLPRGFRFLLEDVVRDQRLARRLERVPL